MQTMRIKKYKSINIEKSTYTKLEALCKYSDTMTSIIEKLIESYNASKKVA